MQKRRTLQELTLKDNFLFAAVMMEQDNCKQLLELALGIEIEYVEVNTEKSEELPNSYVIFICDFDPFMLKKYRYTIKHVLVEDERFTYQDGSHTVFLSTKGKNDDEVPRPLVRFLKFVAVELNESTADFEDEFVERLQASIRRIKSSREMGERFMLFEEMMRNERAEGKAEGKAEAILEILEGYGEISESLRSRIMSEKDSSVLRQLLKNAVQATTVSEFDSMMNL